MLIPSLTTIALRCPGCGKVNLVSLSRFALKERKMFKVVCQCGFCLMHFSRNKKEVCFQTECVICATTHLLKYASGRLWDGRLRKMYCDYAGTEIGYIGPTEEVKQAVENTENMVREITAQNEDEREILNPGIMNQVLTLLQKMSAEERVTCTCGAGELEAEVYHDRVEIYCSYCGAVGIVFAETIKDLHYVKGMDEIHLDAYTYRYLDDIRLRKRGLGPNRKNN